MLYALQLDDDILLLAKKDEMGRVASGFSRGWSFDIPDISWLLWVIRIGRDKFIAIGHSAHIGSL